MQHTVFCKGIYINQGLAGMSNTWARRSTKIGIIVGIYPPEFFFTYYIERKTNNSFSGRTKMKQLYICEEINTIVLGVLLSTRYLLSLIINPKTVEYYLLLACKHFELH